MVRLALLLPIATVGAIMLGRAALGPFSSGDSADLHAAGRSLVPAQLPLLLEQEGACVMLKDDPLCITVYFASGRWARSQRLLMIENAGRVAGWTRCAGPGSAGVAYVRGRYKAFVSLKERDSSGVRPAAVSAATASSRSADSLLVEVRP